MAILKRTKDAEAKAPAAEEKKPAAKKKASTKKAAPAKKAPAKKKDAQLTSNAYRILVRPLVTEKSAQLASEGVYTFQVAPSAGKVAVRQAVKALFGVQPVRVNILNQKGKRVRFGRVQGQRNRWRKAYVYLAKGQHIDVYEGV